MEVRIISSLEKVFPNAPLSAKPYTSGSMLQNERYSFQAACYSKEPTEITAVLTVKADNAILPYLSVREVGMVPVTYPCPEDVDDNIISNQPGFYPDTLLPLKENRVLLKPEEWKTLWISIQGQPELPAGEYPILIELLNSDGISLGKGRFDLKVIPASLPEQSLFYTNWFHSDCLAVYYGVEVFSKEYWKLVEQYLKIAVRYGMNMLLTPLFTPPLDTEVGGERPTVQLIDVFKKGEQYLFGFTKLKHWVRLARQCGITYFEFSHLFTQWGAEFTPKIIAKENGELKRIFGWDVRADSPEYEHFLDQFLPALKDFIEEDGLDKFCFFHVSDEPSLEHLEQYRHAKSLIYRYMKDYPLIDAMSDYDFYETGAVKTPIVSTNHIAPFWKNNVPNLWAYYCCGQYQKVSNRYINLPSARNRILGYQLYKFHIKGFLQWGYNFWFSQYSKYPIDPYQCTDADGAFPAGDPFVVYPASSKSIEDDPVISLRLEVFYDALQDMRALKLAEQIIGREKMLAFLERDLPRAVTFESYPHDSDWILNTREMINRMIERNIGFLKS